jgi:hypothetical protein
MHFCLPNIINAVCVQYHAEVIPLSVQNINYASVEWRSDINRSYVISTRILYNT